MHILFKNTKNENFFFQYLIYIDIIRNISQLLTNYLYTYEYFVIILKILIKH